MREFPSISNYHEAVRNKFYTDRSNIYQPQFKKNGELYFEPGGRAVVYKIADKKNLTKAIKLFTVNKDNLFQKYLSISKFINTINSKYFVEFYFAEKFIFCPDINQTNEDNIFPGLIMNWAEGKTLGTLIKELTGNNDITNLKLLLDKFREAAFFLLASDFGHGDIKHDNIIIDSDMNIKFIDYDDMYIPGFESQSSIELGTPSFQHPKRHFSDFNKNIDDFSILTIYTTILALIKYPFLYQKYEDQQNLLFRQEDFFNPNESELFNTLDKDGELSNYCYLIKKSLNNDNIYIPNLDDILIQKFPEPEITINDIPDKLLEGNEFELIWESLNVDTVILNNQLVNLFDCVKINLQKSANYTFVLKNHFNTKEVVVKLNVLPKIKVSEFKLTKQKIELGKESVLSWNIENYNNITLKYDDIILNVDGQFEITVAPIKDTIYILEMLSLDGLTILRQELKIEVFERIKIGKFNIDMNFVVESFPILLTWEIENESKLTLISSTSSDIDVTGLNSIELRPTKNTSFYLKAENALFSNTSEKINILVQKLPVFDSNFFPTLPSGNDLIPKFQLNLKTSFNNILSESEKEFRDAMKKNNRFSFFNKVKK